METEDWREKEKRDLEGVKQDVYRVMHNVDLFFHGEAHIAGFAIAHSISKILFAIQLETQR